MKLLVLTLALGVFSCLVEGQPFRKDSTQSNRISRKPLSAIVKEKLELFREVIYNGDEEHKVPVLDVYSSPIPLEVNITDKSIRFYSFFEDIYVSGLGEFVIDNIEIKMLQKYMKIDISVPELTMTSNYTMNGLYLHVVPIYGEGDSRISVKGARLAMQSNFVMGNTFSISNTTVQLNLTEIKVHFGNLLNNEPLSEVISEVIGIALEVQFEKMKATLETKIAQMVEQSVNKALRTNPLSSLMTRKSKISNDVNATNRKVRKPVRSIQRKEYNGSSASLKDFRTVALANDYLDEILANVDNLIVLSKLEPFKLPDFEEIAQMEGPVGSVIKAGVTGTHGVFTGLETLHRRGDVILETQGDHIFVKAEVGTYTLKAGYTIDLIALVFDKSFKAKSEVSKVTLSVAFDVNVRTSEVILTNFQVTEFGHIDVKIDAGFFNPVSWIVSPLLELLANAFKTQLVSEIETIGAKLINDLLHSSRHFPGL